MEKLNIAEILKDCPSGMELDCTLFEGLEFDCIVDNEYLPIRCRIKHPNGGYTVYNFTKYGCWLDTTFAKCVIFPKGKTTWEGFQRPFKDGDVAISKRGDIHLLRTEDSSYCVYRMRGFKLPIFDSTMTKDVKIVRLATDEEKQKLFDAIKVNGYRWNAETKTLDPEFKDGDILVGKSNQPFIYKKLNNNNGCFSYCGIDCGGRFCLASNDWTFATSLRFATDEERQKLFNAIKANGYKWNPETKTLEELIEPKFKVGDRVKHISAHASGIVVKVSDKGYHVDYPKGEGVCYISFTLEKDYELAPEKFDITTLKPFDKILTRLTTGDVWSNNFFGYYKDGLCHCSGNCAYRYFIPYKGNEHLLGTKNDCDEYYKTWK